jgi:hypothetical protein
MSFKPDYGLKLLNDGVKQNVNLNFTDFQMFSLTVLGEGEYSTMVEVPFDNQVYAISLDFKKTILEKILSKSPNDISIFLKNELERDPFTQRTIELEGRIVFGVRAHLGELQRAQFESFVPLVAQEIL